jgi:hypothetical protein
LSKKNAAGMIQPGDRLLMELPVAVVWLEDGKITEAIAGTRFSIAEDNPEIRDLLKAAKEKAARGQARIGGSKLSKVFDQRGR